MQQTALVSQETFSYLDISEVNLFRRCLTNGTPLPSVISNTSSINFYSSTMSTLFVKDFLPLAMISQGGSKQILLKQIKKTFSRHSETF